ncbi:putative type I phosphodiesterase/nucleotide pyrophosphatase [Mycobacterium ulcerans str. Harvey]|uniref:Type I phosphodiesterase/nucleotide pyrophosphatase n=1 Tax=Mycobacterium ulcerans str. Harvey TaxID=1299332 RepID=A0ABN0R1I2_MYCUL|nr:putative type I phosphodiesterase/nucleotide pyrophosphatase [Mycobacterium ulcerans str. Harvey]
MYVRDESDIATVASLIKRLDGVDDVLDRSKQQAWSIDHPASESWWLSPNLWRGLPTTTGSMMIGPRSSRPAWTFTASLAMTPPSC